jgi:hypothetical protein
MNKLVMLVGCALTMLAGCATGPVIGPWSYYAVKGNKADAAKRAILRSNAVVDKRHEALKRLSLGDELPQIASDMGQDVVSPLVYGVGDGWLVVGADVLDVLTYGVVGGGVVEGTKAISGGSSDKTINNSITGNDNQINNSNSSGSGNSTSGGQGRQYYPTTSGAKGVK